MLTASRGNGRFQSLALTGLCLAFQAVPLAGFPLLLPLIRQELGLTYSQAGALASANLLVYGLMQIPAGYLADRYSPRKMVVIGVSGVMGLSILLAFTREYWQLILIELFWGFFSSFLFTPAMSFFIRWFGPRHRSTATTLPLVGMNLGVLAVNLLFPLIANRLDSWRFPFVLFGAIGIACGLGLLLLGREAPVKGGGARFRLDLIREIFRYRQIWLCCGLQFIRFGIFQGLGFWLPTLLVGEKGFPLQLAGIVFAVQSVVSASSNIGGAYFADRSRRPTLVIGVSLGMLTITVALLVVVRPMALVILILIVNSIFIQAYFGPLFTLAVEKLGPEKTGLSNGVGNMFAIFGGLSAAYLMGFLRDATGSFRWGLYSICALSVVGLVLTVALEKTRRPRGVPEVH